MALTTRKAANAAKVLREAADDPSIMQRRKLREAAEILETYDGGADAGDDTTTTED